MVRSWSVSQLRFLRWLRVTIGLPLQTVAQDYGHDELKQICRKSPPHFSLSSFMPDRCVPGSSMTVVLSCYSDPV